jgi:hypothetical protein
MVFGCSLPIINLSNGFWVQDPPPQTVEEGMNLTNETNTTPVSLTVQMPVIFHNADQNSEVH